MITYLALRLSNGDYYWGSTAMTLKKEKDSIESLRETTTSIIL